MKYLPRISKRQLTVSGGIVGAAVLTSVSIFATGPSAAPMPNVEKSWPVSVTAAAPATLTPTFTAFGKLESGRVARLRSDLIAPIEAVLVREGAWVEAGELLVKLDDREARLKVLERNAELKQHEAELASARSRLELEQRSAEHYRSKFRVAQDKLTRHEDLMAKRLIAKGLLDEVTSQANQASIDYRNHERELANLPNEIAAHEAYVARAEAQLAQARLDLDRTRITAPFSGPVIGVFAAPGDHTNLSAPLVEIADASAFEVRVQLPDTYVAQVQQSLAAGSALTATTETGDTLHLARVAGHVRSGQTGTDAFFTPDASTELALGRVFSLNIEMPSQPDLIAIPLQAIYDSRRVYTVEDGERLVGHDVARVGERETAANGYEILIRAGDIRPGARIVTTQLPKAINGLLVTVAN